MELACCRCGTGVLLAWKLDVAGLELAWNCRVTGVELAWNWLAGAELELSWNCRGTEFQFRREDAT